MESASPPTPAARAGALAEVILCSDFPTQLAIGGLFALFGYQPFGADGRLSAGYVCALSLIDTAVLVGLILYLVRLHGERPRDILLGARPARPELALGLSLVLSAFALGVTILLAIQHLAPWLHNVPENPLQDLIRTRADLAIFAVVVVVAGGVREEIQRAFILHRFERYLGGGPVGVVVASLAFGAGHLVQGRDAAVATAALGAFWAIVYLRRRSVIAPVVSHSGFNLIELFGYALGRA